MKQEKIVELLDHVNRMTNQINMIELHMITTQNILEELRNEKSELLEKIRNLMETTIEIDHDRLMFLVNRYPRIIKLLRGIYHHSYREAHVILHIALDNRSLDYLDLLQKNKCKNWIEYIKVARQYNKLK